ncbi:MAG: Dabb family protein [Lachnospiraceae bacterium]|jgi:hypothetical protein|nr:Dabb family protein [Lachnospiraceae bacterium]MCI8996188.1 Dabb family protein [Lachnospiraceae bacterium]MCI9134558.1 Dabb family protein [Lachnospiraceae bacterium]
MMVTHIVLWNFRAEVPEEQRAEIAGNIHQVMQELPEKCPGLQEIGFYYGKTPWSNRDLACICRLDSYQALAEYQVQPDHLEVANRYVKPVTKERICFDLCS